MSLEITDKGLLSRTVQAPQLLAQMTLQNVHFASSRFCKASVAEATLELGLSTHFLFLHMCQNLQFMGQVIYFV